ncbi:right-handed parallel beta-helix repeat-containing protein [Rhodopirellula sp. JC740]|uniref:Right-handed parallel beta-helix repeat-containing protein n=1 Tax=Rhodopirellula halodulae TaxID=2894198 RepID=A0ABS8NDW5_9BACT|nr:right-handed parallel beta-helix repeat-containing protein [Rhodopirellula sp. JC740]MCC9641751.1 right-handed parallel beta-helix repeat-containing protein [Rhodopirellula sp. JC740]
MNILTTCKATVVVFAFLLLSCEAADRCNANEALPTPAYAEIEYHDRYLDQQWRPSIEPGMTLYVSPEREPGNETPADGSKQNPFTDLNKVRDHLRDYRKASGLPPGGVEVVLRPGRYKFEQPVVFGKIDSGTAKSPVIFRAERKGSVVFTAGESVDLKAAKVASGADLDRLKPSAHGAVMVLSIPASQQSLLSEYRRPRQISLDGNLLTLAQWPNLGYCHIDDIFDQGPTTRWLKPGEKPVPGSLDAPNGARFDTVETLSPLVQKEFARTRSMQVEGYFHNDWYFQREPVGMIRDGVVQLMQHTRYGVANKIKSIPRRVRLVNVLAELDEPGEWYYDADDARLYFWPTKGFDRRSSTLALLWSEHPAILQLKDVSYTVFRDIVFEDTGRAAVTIQSGEACLLSGCTFRNGAQRGVSIDGGLRHGITGCEFHDLESAFSMRGGDFKTLERCYHHATNNEVHSCRRRGYGVMGMNGVGLYFAHNLVHDMNGALSFNAVDTLMEFNEFYNIGYEMGDFNVAYCGANWHMMNNVLRFNFVHHLFEPGGHPIFGFRNDDGGMGLQMFGNVFYRSGRGAAQFQGPLNSFRNNITMKSGHMWWTNKSAITADEVAAEWKGLERFGRDLPHGDKGDNIYLLEQMLGKNGWNRPPWSEEFPKLGQAIALNPFAQTFCVVADNYVNEVRVPFHVHGGSGTVEGMESRKTGRVTDLPKSGHFELPEKIGWEAFVDVEKLDFTFREDFPTPKGFQPIPFDQIGLKTDASRPGPVDRSYRAKVYQRFKDERGGRYDAESINARYRLMAN